MAGDAEEFRAIVEWARREGVLLSSLTVGSVSATMADPHAMRLPDVKPGDAESAISEYGGESLAEAIRGLAQREGDEP